MPSAARLMRVCAPSLLVCSALWLSACKSPPPPPPEPPKKPTGLFEWNGDNKKAISNIVINVDDQKAYLYQGEDQVGWTYVATGISSFPTPTGDFKVLEKVQNKVSNLYGKAYTAEGKLSNSDFKIGRDLVPAGGRFAPAKMPYFMRLTGDGVGMHIGPIPRPGRRASHGCIRMPAKMAPIVFNHISIGTPVSITGSGPDYQTYLKQAAKKSHQNAAKLAAATKKAAEEKASADAAAGIVPPVGEPATAPGTVTAAPGAPTPSSTTPATASPATTTPAAAPGSATVTTLPVNKPSFLPPTDVVRPALPATPPKEPNQ